MSFNIEVYDHFTVINLPFNFSKPINEELLSSNLKDLVNLGHINIIINFSNKKLITDSIYKMLIEAHNLCKSKGGKLRINFPKNELEMISYFTDVNNMGSLLADNKPDKSNIA